MKMRRSEALAELEVCMQYAGCGLGFCRDRLRRALKALALAGWRGRERGRHQGCVQEDGPALSSGFALWRCCSVSTLAHSVRGVQTELT